MRRPPIGADDYDPEPEPVQISLGDLFRQQVFGGPAFEVIDSRTPQPWTDQRRGFRVKEKGER